MWVARFLLYLNETTSVYIFKNIHSRSNSSLGNLAEVCAIFGFDLPPFNALEKRKPKWIGNCNKICTTTNLYSIALSLVFWCYYSPPHTHPPTHCSRPTHRVVIQQDMTNVFMIPTMTISCKTYRDNHWFEYRPKRTHAQMNVRTSCLVSEQNHAWRTGNKPPAQIMNIPRGCVTYCIKSAYWWNTNVCRKIKNKINITKIELKVHEQNKTQNRRGKNHEPNSWRKGEIRCFGSMRIPCSTRGTRREPL